jgi:hypothetical protein
MIDFTPYINKADMQEIAVRIRDIFWEFEGNEDWYLYDEQFDYKGWVITFSGYCGNNVYEISEITFSPAFAEQANQIINL